MGMLNNPLLQIGLGMLSQSGPSRYPTGWSGVANGALQGMQNYQNLQNNAMLTQMYQARIQKMKDDAEMQKQIQEAVAKLAQTETNPTLANLARLNPSKYLELKAGAMMPIKPTSLMQNVGAAGYTPGTPEYQQAMMNQLNPSKLKTPEEINQEIDLARRKEQTKMQVQLNPTGEQGVTGVGQIDPNIHGEQFLSTIPQNISAQVKALAEGRQQFPSSFALRAPYWNHMLQLVAQYDPSFDATNYQLRYNTRKDFTSGKSAQNITNINQLIGHMGSLKGAMADMGNSNQPWWNSFTQAVLPMFGNTKLGAKVRTFDTAKEAVANEMMRVFRGTGASSSDTEKWAHNFNRSDSPEAMNASLNEGLDLLQSRIDAMNEQYKRGMGTDASVMNLLNPKALSVLSDLESGQAPPANFQVSKPPKTKPPAGITQQEWDYMTPEERALWN